MFSIYWHVVEGVDHFTYDLSLMMEWTDIDIFAPDIALIQILRFT